MNQESPKPMLGKLLNTMRREGLQRERVEVLESAERCFFESSSDSDHGSVKRIHDAAEAMLAAGTFHLPAEVVLIEDPAGFARQFYLCTETDNGIEVWGATLFQIGGQPIVQLYEKPQWIATGKGHVAQPDYRASLNTPLIAVKEFVVLLNSDDCELEEVPDRKFPITVVRRRSEQSEITCDGKTGERMLAADRVRQAAEAKKAAAQPSRLPVDAGIQYADFVDDARRGHVKVRLADGRLNSVPAHRDLSSFAVPVYDFGHMFSPDSADYIGRELDDEIARNTPDDFSPADDACAFMFRFGDNDIVWLARVERTATGEGVESFMFSRQEPFWQKVGLPGQSNHMVDLGTDIAFRVASADLMLARWRSNLEIREAVASGRAMRVNAEFQSKGASTLPPTKVIRVLDKRIRFVGSNRGSHASPVGHERTLTTYTVPDRQVTYTHPKTGKLVTYQRKPKIVRINRTIPVNGGRKVGNPAGISNGQPRVIYEVRA